MTLHVGRLALAAAVAAAGVLLVAAQLPLHSRCACRCMSATQSQGGCTLLHVYLKEYRS